jgi:hypothetical protein
MKAFPKAGLLVVVALLATAAAATGAQAVSINPNGAQVTGLSNNSSLTYGVAFATCDTATAIGNIVHIPDDPATPDVDETVQDRISDLALTFTDNCAIAGVGPADVACEGTVTLIADPAADDFGTVDLNEGFQCVVTTAICTVTVAGPQTTQPKNTFLDEANQVLEADVTVHATRTGSLLCGPPEGDGAFTADYAITNNSDPPVPVTIDP